MEVKESKRKGKRYTAYFKDGTEVHFGAKGGQTYIDHRNEEMRKNYIARHGAGNEDWNNPRTAGALARWLLWEKPTIGEALIAFKRKFRDNL